MQIAASFTVKGHLPGLNEYTKACNNNRYNGARIKKQTETLILWHIYEAKIQNKNLSGVWVKFFWHEKEKRRDLDNVAAGKKFLLDALQTSKTIAGDGWRDVKGFEDRFFIDKKNPRIVVEIWVESVDKS